MEEKNIPDNPAPSRFQFPDRFLLRISVLRLPRDFPPSSLPVPFSLPDFQFFYDPFEIILRNMRSRRWSNDDGNGMGNVCVKSGRTLSVK